MTIEWQLHYDENAPEHIDFEPHYVQKFLDDAADNFGKRNAIAFHNYKLNYAQLRESAERLAATLKDLGIQKGDRIAIMLPNIPQTMIAFWGAMKAGAIIVMTNPLYMERELTHHFQDSKPKILITLDLFWSKLEPFRERFSIAHYIVTRVSESLAFPLNYLQTLKAKRSGDFKTIPFDDTVIPWKNAINNKNRYSVPCDKSPKNTIALLQYTGGTTGFSKGAMLTHANLTIQIQQLMLVLHAKPKTDKHIFISVMPFFHIFGLMGCLVMPAVYAAPSIPIPRYVPSDLLDVINKFKPTLFIGAPSIYISLMQQKKIDSIDMKCIKFCISASSPFPLASMQRFQKITNAKITEGFGLTESSPTVIANPLFGVQKSGSIGVPIPGTIAKIVDTETGTIELPDNEPGELLVKGPQVMLGYWNHPEETANSIRDGWLYTGDIAYRDSDGYYFIVDRKKDMAIVGGYNVFPSEIDEVLYEYPKVSEAVALSVPHRSKGEILKAYIVPKAGENISSKELMAYCREKLASYKVPRLIEIREELPKSMVGKILRRALRDEEEQKLNKDKNNATKIIESENEESKGTVIFEGESLQNNKSESVNTENTERENTSSVSTSKDEK